MTEKKSPAAGNVTIERNHTKHENLAAALAAVQAEIPSVKKDATATVETKTGGQYKYQYADLAVITPLILPLLGANGLAWSTRPTLMGEAFVLHYTLAHEGGESIEGVYPLPEPLTGRPQEIGSAITYARRYALCAVTGIAPGGDDDDAAAANEKPAAGRKPRGAKADRDWKAAIAKASDLATLTALANEAQANGHWSDPIVDDAGETTVGAALHARRTLIESQAEPLPGSKPGKVEPRAWLDEAKALKYSEDVAALWREADALGANGRILEALTEMVGRLPARPEGEPAPDWAPVAEDEPADEGPAAVLDESVEPVRQ